MSGRDNWKFMQVVLWYVAAWLLWGLFGFFPFGLVSGAGAIGGTGFILCVVIVVSFGCFSLIVSQAQLAAQERLAH